MSFQTGLSGLNASSRSLDVIGNNIANANTTGMKSSRAEFSSLVASSIGSGASGGAGIGVEVAAISQQFTQGNITTTGNSLDAAINGGGFFQLTQPDGSMAYSRDGSFKLDKDGYIKTNAGANVMGYPTDKTGKPTSASIQKLQLPTNAPIGASETTNITAEFNLDARAKLAAGAAAVVGPPAVAAIPVTPRATYGTSLNVYDAQGVASPVNLYFEKNAASNTWDVYKGLADVPNVGDNTTPLGQITFDAAGKITGPVATAPATGFALILAAGTVASSNPNETTGFLPQAINMDLSTVTQFGAAFAISNLTQDGYTAGELTSLSIGEDGVITTRYSNGQTQSAGQVTLADFRNAQGLSPLGGNAWSATFASGEPVMGSPGVGKFGALRSGALEESNVDLTSELVNMMTAQRAYQANAQTIKTQDQVMSTLVNLR
jgi:flagellar hook protein FlgE